MRNLVAALAVLAGSGVGLAAEAGLAGKPVVEPRGDGVAIRFAASRPTDVEVAILDGKGAVVRHLAAGVLGGTSLPPPPLKAGLSQELTWDKRDDLGAAVADGAGPYKVRVRTGWGVKFGRFIGDDPYVMGAITSLATDADGQLYIASPGGNTNQNYDCLRLFTCEGAYLRTLMPFPADLPPDAAKGMANWDEQAKLFRPINRSNTNPAFVPWTTGARVVSASPKAGIVLSHGNNIYRLDSTGGNLTGPFPMWSKAAKLENPSWNVPQLAVSPDGRYIYYANVAGTKYDTKKPEEINPKWPNGRVYRQDTKQAGSDPQPFFDLTLPEKYWMPNAWNKRTAANGLDVDAKGNVYVCDLANQEVVQVSPEGKRLNAVKVPWPDRVHVNRATGDLYVISGQPRDGRLPNKLFKVSGWGDAGKIVIELQLKGRVGDASALGAIKGQAVLWLAGGADLLCLRDAGAKFEEQETAFRPGAGAQNDFSRIAVDPLREQVYTSNGVNRFWRYDGATGKGEPLVRNGKPFLGVDLAVGYDGLLYVRTGEGYSGPLERYTPELAPAPMESGSHVFTNYVYSRYGVGFCEKGLGVGPKGEVYVNFMYGWNLYLVAGFNGDGTPKKGLYLEGKFGRKELPAGIDPKDPKNKEIVDAARQSQGFAAGWNSAVVGPVPAVCGGVRVDLQGNIYVGVINKPKDYKPPADFAKDPAYASFTGSVIKFGPAGGTILGLPDGQAKQPGSPTIELDRKCSAENALGVYPGIAPFSGGGYGNNTSSCVCRVARFDVDRFGRVFLPNAVSNSVIAYDNAGNRIGEFGAYGNFDSLYVNPMLDVGAKPTVAGPAIPLGWPVGVGASEKSLYVCDMYNRRVVRVDQTNTAEEIIDIK